MGDARGASRGSCLACGSAAGLETVDPLPLEPQLRLSLGAALEIEQKGDDRRSGSETRHRRERAARNARDGRSRRLAHTPTPRSDARARAEVLTRAAARC